MKVPSNGRTSFAFNRNLLCIEQGKCDVSPLDGLRNLSINLIPFPCNDNCLFHRDILSLQNTGLAIDRPKGEKEDDALGNQGNKLNDTHYNQPKCTFDEFPLYGYVLILLALGGVEALGQLLLGFGYRGQYGLYRFVVGGLLCLCGFLGLLSVGCAAALDDPLFWLPRTVRDKYDPYKGACGQADISHGRYTVTQKLLTMPYYCNTLIAIGRANMANILAIESK